MTERTDPEKPSDSKTIKEHRALINQSSVKADDYPETERKDQSLVDKSKPAKGSVVNAAPKQDEEEG
ncbi:hypothetical protein [Qipengyuania sp. JC766]|uniref:hypothetical protein n=1 Tax=Qipengyuania sp. JC766 TaxID=3232139 RepID=UPI00345747DD